MKCFKYDNYRGNDWKIVVRSFVNTSLGFYQKYSQAMQLLRRIGEVALVKFDLGVR